MSDSSEPGNEAKIPIAAPAFDFAPVQKASIDLFARAPQVKKLTRRDKQRIARELDVKEAAAKQKGGATKRQRDADEKVEGREKPSSTKDLFETVLDTSAVERELAQQEKQRTSRRKKKTILRHALHSNEEEDAKTVYIGNLPNTVDKRDVEKLFKDCGTITAVRVRCQVLTDSDNEKTRNLGRAVRVLRGDIKKDEKCSATAYVLFESAESVSAALAKNGIIFKNRHIVVTAMDVDSRAYAPQTSVFLGNVAYDTTEEDVWAYFQEHGVPDVKRVRLVRDRNTGQCQGFGYVEFSKASSVEPAIATRGAMLNDRPLRIVHVNKTKEAAGGPGGSRRDKRKLQHQADGSVKGSRQDRRGARKETAIPQKAKRSSDLPSWAGVTTNPRRKMPKDLRPLVEGKTEFKPRGPRAPVKRKMRNPEK